MAGLRGRVQWMVDRRARFVRVGDTLVPSQVELYVDAERGGPYLVAVFVLRDGRPECTSLVVRAKPDGRAIRSTDYAGFGVDEYAVELLAQFSLRVTTDTVQAIVDRGLATVLGGLDERERWAVRDDLHDAVKARRGVPSRDELERVAEVYRAHADDTPTSAVALLLGYSTRTAQRRVKQAEQAGLLPPTTPGKRRV